MPVYKNEKAKGNKWYYSLNYKENGKFKSTTKRGFKTKKEAEAALVEIQDQINKACT
ncbi:Arm DNA-binding domain-containing protein [Geomicrobium sp. JCM 19037]|uniref:Arm DNA-binding domain-containing protein n=1 Tax=Geomicrobium sp. JCM 19037 TaxID=1460634 RepID=UPI0026A28416|nr:Arm DNA-binding domain-containing protein [Geomicrobium sp. JCM 19037]